MDEPLVTFSDSEPSISSQQDGDAILRCRIMKLLMCPVCFETTTDPKGLNCTHFCCAACMEILAGDSGLAICPLCHRNTQLEEDGAVSHELANRLIALLEDVPDDQPNSQPNQTELLNIEASVDDATQTSKTEDTFEIETQIVAPDPSLHAQTQTTEPEVAIQPEGLVENKFQDPEPTPVENGLGTPEPTKETPAVESPAVDSHTVDSPTADKPAVDKPTEKPVEVPIEANVVVTSTEDLASSTSNDQVDRVMSPQEVKTAEMKVNTDQPLLCPTCRAGGDGEKACRCNCLLTPPVSSGSIQSIDMNVSQSASDDSEICVQLLQTIDVPESASQVEVSSKDKIFVSRWTFDDAGSITAFTSKGQKFKPLSGCKGNYSGITRSKKGYLFALNTTKNRIEEYNYTDGSRLKTTKLEMCRDPHAIDIATNGIPLVVDQESNRVLVYHRGTRPAVITHELIKEPYDIAATSSGFLITCALTHCVLHLSLKGALIWAFGVDSTEGKLRIPKGICVGEDGLIYVVDSGSKSVVVLNQDGEMQGRLCDKSQASLGDPWFISARDGIIAILNSRNKLRLYQKI